MDLKDMILVIENDRGTETNMLMTLDDYKSFIAVDDMSELADNLLQLGRTLDVYKRQEFLRVYGKETAFYVWKQDTYLCINRGR